MALSSSAAYTTDFHHEFRVETERLLLRRFLWFTGVIGGMLLLGLLVRTGALIWARSSQVPLPRGWPWWFLALIWVAMYVAAFWYARSRRPVGDVLVRLSIGIVAIDGLMNVLMRALDLPAAGGLLAFTLTHFLACALLPWTPKQAIRPAVLVLLVSAAVQLLWETPLWSSTVETIVGVSIGIVLSPLLVAPGFAICWLRHSRRMETFKLRFLQNKYGEMRRELVDARRIHESLFPTSIAEGPVRLSYEYEPMRAIGGDFLFAHRRLDGPLSIVLLDVTGHGIPAALTVNRLHGELERVFAENPDIGPGEVLRLLNRYVHLTLATHSIYATALCFRIDPRTDRLEYASGGHPPAFVRGVDGTLEELESTSFVLGACAGQDFDPAPRSVPFGAGDCVVAYTDGAIEARDSKGAMLRIEGLRRLLASASDVSNGSWPGVIRSRVMHHRSGPAADDTLIIEVYRPIGQRDPASGVTAAGHRASVTP